MSTVNPSVTYNEGCSAAAAFNASPSGYWYWILDFGQPAVSGITQGQLLFNLQFASETAITNAAKGWWNGWNACWNGSGYKWATHLIIGTSNHGSSLTPAFGTAFSNTISAVKSSYGGIVNTYGGMDIEPSWGTSATVLAFEKAFNAQGGNYLDDFGSADGCPTTYSGVDGKCNNGWTLSSRYQAAYGQAHGNPIPEIYTPGGSMAAQWHSISRYGADFATTGRVSFVGTLAQYQACVDTGQACTGTKNTWTTAHQQLNDALVADPKTALSADYLYAGGDCTWQN